MWITFGTDKKMRMSDGKDLWPLMMAPDLKVPFRHGCC